MFSFGNKGFSGFESFNGGRRFDVDVTGFKYYSLKEMMEESGDPEKIYIVKGLYINTKGLYDVAPVAALDDRYVNLPSHLTSVVEAILDDKRAVAAINAGKCGFKIREYKQEKYDKLCQSIEWVDVK